MQSLGAWWHTALGSPATALTAMEATGGSRETCAAWDSVSDSVSVKYVGSQAIML